MQVVSYQVHNILKVSDLDLSMEGRNLVLVGGANGHGKTSALTALLMALCGKSGMDWPDISLKEGESEGHVTVFLSGDEELHEPNGLKVELSLRKKRGGVVAEEFRVLDSTGEEAPEPRALLKRLYEMRGFDPLDFERAKPKARAELLRKLVGLDFEALDTERAEVYSERTTVNKEGVSRKAEMDAIEVPEGTPDEPINVSDVFEDLQSRRKQNQHHAVFLKDLADLQAREQKLQDEEERLKARLVAIDAERKKLDGDIEQTEEAIKSHPEVELGDLEEKIISADKVNQAVSKKQRKAGLAKIVSELRGKSQKLSDRLKDIDEEKQARLEAAKWPLPGLSLDETGVLLDGLPFEQASKAQRVMASVRIGMALNPKLRLLVCQDGNDLDNDTLASLEASLKENDFQMLLELVTRSPDDEERCAVVFHEGAAKARPKKEPAEVLLPLE